MNDRTSEAAWFFRLFPDFIDVDKLQPRCLQAFLDHARKPLQKRVAKVVIFVGFSAKAFTIQGDRSRQFVGLGGELPAVRRKEPRPTQHISFAKGLDDDGTAWRSVDLRGHLAVADEIALVGFPTLQEHELSGFKAHVGCSSN